jgi:hypothetical protein
MWEPGGAALYLGLLLFALHQSELKIHNGFLLLEGAARPRVSSDAQALASASSKEPPGHLWRVSRNMRFMFRCPATGYVAQGVVPSDKPGERPRYRLVRCTACKGVHFVDPTTGEVIVTTTKDRDYDNQTKT